MPVDISQHPCFNEDTRHKTGRIHLPVAPKCNVRCNFCNRRFDCMNESRPGVSSSILSPGQTLSYLDYALTENDNIRVVGIAGPGDPFANPDETMETLRRVRHRYPDMILCVATNGLGIGPHIVELAELQVSHITITVNAVDPKIAGSVYAWVRPDKRPLRGTEAGQLVIQRQREAIQAIKQHDIILKINTIVINDINDKHIPKIAATMAELGADVLNCMPMTPVAGTPFAPLGEPTSQAMARIRLLATQYLPQMGHCAQCRADAVGLIGEEMTDEQKCCLQRASQSPLEPESARPHIAVATREGMLVNQHLGEADQVWIFGPNYSLIETRPTPPPGGGETRWQTLADTLHDCRTILCSGAGKSPTTVFQKNGIETIMMNGLIQEALAAVYNGEPVKSPIRKHRCGSGCSGDGLGCG